MQPRASWFGYYLIAGVVYQLFAYHSLNAFRIGFWLHILFWLPLLILHWFVSILMLLIIVGLAIWIGTSISPEFNKFVSYVLGGVKKAFT